MALGAFVLALIGSAGLGAGAAQSSDEGSSGRPVECGRYASSTRVGDKRSKNACLVEAFRRGTRATLVVERFDRSGSPVAEEHFRVLAVNRLELLLDVKADRFGAQRWQRFICRELLVRRGVSVATRRCVETPLTANGAGSGPRQLDCGRFVLRFEPMTADLEEGNRCLLRAFQRGAFAMLVVTRPTIEGDPLTTYYAVLGPRRAERLVDATRDRFSVRRWYRFVCEEISINSRGSLDFRSCCESVLPPTFPRS